MSYPQISLITLKKKETLAEPEGFRSYPVLLALDDLLFRSFSSAKSADPIFAEIT